MRSSDDAFRNRRTGPSWPTADCARKPTVTCYGAPGRLKHLAGVSGLTRDDAEYSQVIIAIWRARLYYLTQRCGA